MKLTTEVSAQKEQYGTILVTVHDKYGNEIKKLEQGVDSFNRQMWRTFFGWATGISTSAFPLIGLNNATTTSVDIGGKSSDGGLNNYNGIVIGTGTNPTTYDKVIMDNIIQYSSDGTTNTVQAQESTIEYINTDRTATVSRTFLNLSSSPITVNEVGIALSTSSGGAITLNGAYLCVRDVLESSISFDFEQILTVQYKVRIASGTYNYSNLFIQSQFGTNRSNSAIQMTNTTGTMSNITGTYRTTIIANDETSTGLITNTGNTNQSIVLGTGNSAFNVSQIDLISGITHGSGAGQLFYHPASYTNMVENSTTNSMRFTINRTVENRSGSNIAISEVGLFKSGGTSKFLLDRKVITPVTITNGSTLSFQWEFCYTV
jgi:hypothetical protein